MGKTYHKQPRDRDDEGHNKRASRRGHSHLAKYTDAATKIDPSQVRKLRPEDLYDEDGLNDITG